VPRSKPSSSTASHWESSYPTIHKIEKTHAQKPLPLSNKMILDLLRNVDEPTTSIDDYFNGAMDSSTTDSSTTTRSHCIYLNTVLEMALYLLLHEERQPSIEATLHILKLCIKTIYDQMIRLESEYPQLEKLLSNSVEDHKSSLNRLSEQMSRYLNESTLSDEPDLSILLPDLSLFAHQFPRHVGSILSDAEVSSCFYIGIYGKLSSIIDIATVNICRKFNALATNDNLQATMATKTPKKTLRDNSSLDVRRCDKIFNNILVLFKSKINPSPSSSSSNDRTCGKLTCTIL